MSLLEAAAPGKIRSRARCAIRSAVTLYENEENEVHKCVARIVLNSRKFDIICTMHSPVSLQDLPLLFNLTEIDARCDWRIRDDLGLTENMLDTELENERAGAGVVCKRGTQEQHVPLAHERVRH